MVLDDNELELANIFFKLENGKLTQADRATILKFVGESESNFYEILRRVITSIREDDSIPYKDKTKTIITRYKQIGLDDTLDPACFKGYLEYFFENQYMTPEERLVRIKALYEANANCSDVKIKNGIYMEILRQVLLTTNVAKDKKFYSEILGKVNAMTADERAEARIIY